MNLIGHGLKCLLLARETVMLISCPKQVGCTSNLEFTYNGTYFLCT